MRTDFSRASALRFSAQFDFQPQGVVDQRGSFRRGLAGNLLRLPQTRGGEKAVRGVERNGKDAAGTTVEDSSTNPKNSRVCVCVRAAFAFPCIIWGEVRQKGRGVPYHFGGL